MRNLLYCPLELHQVVKQHCCPAGHFVQANSLRRAAEPLATFEARAGAINDALDLFPRRLRPLEGPVTRGIVADLDHASLAIRRAEH